MKFDCGETREEKKERLSKWHSFFAILPRRVGKRDCRWLEVIERRRSRNCWRDDFTGDILWSEMRWEYRAKEKK